MVSSFVKFIFYVIVVVGELCINYFFVGVFCFVMFFFIFWESILVFFVLIGYFIGVVGVVMDVVVKLFIVYYCCIVLF